MDSAKDFRKELTKIMPGYKWTVHQDKFRAFDDPDYFSMSATGIQSSGFNRLSTLHVVKRMRFGRYEYEVKSSGYGRKAPWIHECTDTTLARALRELQNHYEAMASKYSEHAHCLRDGRTAQGLK